MSIDRMEESREKYLTRTSFGVFLIKFLSMSWKWKRLKTTRHSVWLKMWVNHYIDYYCHSFVVLVTFSTRIFNFYKNTKQFWVSFGLWVDVSKTSPPPVCDNNMGLTLTSPVREVIHLSGVFKLKHISKYFLHSK